MNFISFSFVFAGCVSAMYLIYTIYNIVSSIITNHFAGVGKMVDDGGRDRRKEHNMGKIIGKLLEWAGVKDQLRKDLSKLLLLAGALAQKAEDEMGPGKGAEKRRKALNDFFDEVEKPGGIDLPDWLTGDTARWLFGALLDYVVSLFNGDKPKNSSGA